MSANGNDCDFFEKVFPNIWPMTSREFHTDPNARADLIACHLKDGTMRIFEEVIRFNRHIFKDKIVLVLNTGLDLCFPLWAAKYGAAHVYAVDSSKAVDYMEALVEPNNMRETITVLKGRIQDIELPVEKVDIILSNWMGYALLIEDKIQSVIYARDKWLKSAGIIFPDCADLLITGVQNSKTKNQRINWWLDVDNFNMKAIRNVAATEPTFQKVDPNEVLTMPVRVWSLNLKTVRKQDLCFQNTFYIEIIREGNLEGLLAYFDIQFSKSHVPVQFSTSPWAPYTKWLQTVFFFDEPISVNVGERFHGGLQMQKNALKDGTFATRTYLELYSGIKANLSLVLKRTWLYKWVYVDHTDGVENKNGQMIANRSSTGTSSSNSVKEANGAQKHEPVLKAVVLKNAHHDWSFDTMKKELEEINTKKAKKRSPVKANRNGRNNIKSHLPAKNCKFSNESSEKRPYNNVDTSTTKILFDSTFQKDSKNNAGGNFVPKPMRKRAKKVILNGCIVDHTKA